MSIKPIDLNTMIPKTYDISSSKHIENVKAKNIVESGFIHQEKTIKRNIKKVRDLEKNDKSKILKENDRKKQGYSGKKKHPQKTKDGSNKEPSTKTIGHNVDIRI